MLQNFVMLIGKSKIKGGNQEYMGEGQGWVGSRLWREEKVGMSGGQGWVRSKLDWGKEGQGFVGKKRGDGSDSWEFEY